MIWLADRSVSAWNVEHFETSRCRQLSRRNYPQCISRAPHAKSMRSIDRRVQCARGIRNVYGLHFFAKLYLFLNITHPPWASRNVLRYWYPPSPLPTVLTAPPSTNSSRWDVLSIDRNCDKRSEETISHGDNATACCLFYHIKSVKFKYSANRHQQTKTWDLCFCEIFDVRYDPVRVVT